MLPPWTSAAILEEALVTPRRAYLPLPDLQVVERPGWLQLVTPSFKDGGFNEVALTVLGDAEADAVIDATIADYRRLGAKFRWSVAPGSKPDDLAERLARRGLSRAFVRAMARSTADAPPVEGREVEVKEVDAASLPVFSRVMAEGWQMERGPIDAVNELALRQTIRPQRFFLATVGGEPAATASYFAFPRSAYLMGGVTLPRHRGRGLYRALVAARLADAAARGIELATSQALDTTSAPLLERMGFETICRYPVYRG